MIFVLEEFCPLICIWRSLWMYLAVSTFYFQSSLCHCNSPLICFSCRIKVCKQKFFSLEALLKVFLVRIQHYCPKLNSLVLTVLDILFLILHLTLALLLLMFFLLFDSLVSTVFVDILFLILHLALLLLMFFHLFWETCHL